MKPNVVGGQRALLWLSLGWLGLPLSTGCVRERQEQDAKVEKEHALTAEIAKRALLEMDPGQIPPGVIVPGPKNEPITFLNANEITVGEWNCNLKEKTFHVFQAFPEAIRHKQNEVSGVFERTPGGKWVAKVTDAKSGG